MDFWKKNHFELILTADGSPSLVMRAQVKESSAAKEPSVEVDGAAQAEECMHHRAGAWAETQMIYEAPLLEKMNNSKDGGVYLSVGLGLGYNEMMIVHSAIKLNYRVENIISYESSPVLRELFIRYVYQEILPTEVQDTYDQVVACILRGSSIQAALLKNELRNFIDTGKLILKEELGFKSLPKEDLDCILFDAFSNKFSPELWTEEFLEKLLDQGRSGCVFTTYACTGNLKRSLKNKGYERIERAGFSGRRESTLAIRR